MNLAEIPKIIENKYFLLLTTLVLLIAASPMIEHELLNFTITSSLFFAIIIFMLVILGAGKVLFSLCTATALLAFLLHYLSVFVLKNQAIEVLALSAYTLFIAIAILFMFRKIFSEKKVTADTVMGGISIYILLGVWWQVLYAIIWLVNRAAFTLAHQVRGVPDFFYFSFTTMTTLGYGDILPLSSAAKSAAMLQAMTGQIYMAVLVARLVGLHAEHSRQNKDG